MRAERLSLAHQGLLRERLRRMNSSVSEYGFPNLYLFRRIHDYEVLMDGEVFVRGRSYDGFTYVMPTADIRDLDMGLLRELLEECDFIYPVPEERLGLFAPRVFAYCYRDGDSDYVYTAHKLRTYPGRRLHKKRNLAKQYEESYRHEEAPLTGDRLKDARLVLEDWLETSGQSREETDYYACRDAIEHYDELALCGGIYYAQGEPAGFVIGEEQSDDTFVYHFAKGRTKFKGVYQHIMSSFARTLPEKYRYINVEQDLGKEALRTAKASYLPDLKLIKARVTLANRGVVPCT